MLENYGGDVSGSNINLCHKFGVMGKGVPQINNGKLCCECFFRARFLKPCSICLLNGRGCQDSHCQQEVLTLTLSTAGLVVSWFIVVFFVCLCGGFLLSNLIEQKEQLLSNYMSWDQLITVGWLELPNSLPSVKHS